MGKHKGGYVATILLLAIFLLFGSGLGLVWVGVG